MSSIIFYFSIHIHVDDCSSWSLRCQRSNWRYQWRCHFGSNGLAVFLSTSFGSILVSNHIFLYELPFHNNEFTTTSTYIFRSEQVFQNTVHAIVAGVVAAWWFDPEDGSGCCSGNVIGATCRATTTSFGSICFGSLLVAIIQTLRALVNSVRADDDVEGCAAFMLCLVDCCLSCLEGMLEYFNKFAYIYVG